MNLLTILPFLLLLAAVLGLWLHRLVWIPALVLAVVAGYYTGALREFAALWLACAALLAWLYTVTRARASSARGRTLQWAAGATFSAVALAVAMAAVPGFIRIELVAPQVLSAGAAPYALAVGFPKVVVGILILGIINPVLAKNWRELGSVLARAWPIFACTVVVVMIFALAMGYTAFSPHWTSLFLPWAAINLLFTCQSEEAFFRGFVQRELAQCRSRFGSAPMIALVVGAVLFGLVHIAGGVTYMIAGALAGLGYGWAFHRTQRIEAATAVHFGVNATHFLLFVYPRLA